MNAWQTIWEWTGTGAGTVRQRKAQRREPGPGQVEIAVKAIGICGTDLHIVNGNQSFADPPMPLGHELAGVVERTGADAANWRPGDRVCVDPLIGCGYCAACKSGNKHLCNRGVEIGLHLPGGWQQFMLVPGANLHRIPDDLSWEEATQAETLHCCLSGVDKLRIRLGMRAAVIGDGPTGLLFVQLLKASGVDRVVLAGRREYRMQLGRQLGADDTVSAHGEIGDHDSRYDLVVDAAGTESSFAMAVRLLSKGGQCLLFGVPGAPIQADIASIVLKEIRMYGTTNDTHVWERAIALMRSRKVEPSKLVTHRFGFDRLDQAVAEAGNKTGPVKVIVTL